MESKISEKYARLEQACKRYPEIVLPNIEERGGYLSYSKNATIYEKPVVRAKNGFIEKFCL